MTAQTTILLTCFLLLTACKPDAIVKSPIIKDWAIQGLGWCTDNGLHTKIRFVNIRGDNVMEVKCGGPIDYDKDYKHG